jgi:N-acetylglucosaminyl-diphospho-decaprenol L-rhamnosyltransferase
VVTVAVVSWNTRELLLRCLDSLAPEVEAGRAEVWVVDNASDDGSAEAARQAGRQIRVLEVEQNIGFGRAVNLVAERTTKPWLLASNSDVALRPGALEMMIRAGQDPRVGSVAPRLLLPDGATEHSVHPLPTLPLTLAFNLGLHRVSKSLGERLCLEGFWNSDRARPVPWAIGACLLIRRVAFEQLGGFDDRQWLYAEDLDLGWRLHEHGWITRYEPGAQVVHCSGAATSLAFGADRQSRFMAATYSMIRRRRGATRMWITVLLNIAGAAGRLAWMTPLAIVSHRWRRPRDENRRWLRAHLRGMRRLPNVGSAT